MAKKKKLEQQHEKLRALLAEMEEDGENTLIKKLCVKDAILDSQKHDNDILRETIGILQANADDTEDEHNKLSQLLASAESTIAQLEVFIQNGTHRATEEDLPRRKL